MTKRRIVLLNGIEKGYFMKLFNRGGYVLDFSTNEFDTFTLESIGESLCQKYNLSKGKSLLAYVDKADDDKILKLFADLLDYYEANCINDYGEEKYKSVYTKCKSVIAREKGSIIIETPEINSVNYSYIKSISQRAIRDIENGEYDSALTKSRTLLEEVFCHAIEAKKITPVTSGDIGSLYKQVKELKLLLDAHRVNERLVSVAQVNRAPNRSLGDRRVGPLSVFDVHLWIGNVLAF